MTVWKGKNKIFLFYLVIFSIEIQAMKLASLSLVLCLLVHFMLYAQNNPPQHEGSLFSVEVGNLSFEADSAFGAKVSSLSIDGSEFLVSSDMVSSDFLWGSTLWPSPQSEWAWNENKYKWDHQSFTSSLEADTMRFTGEDVSVDNGDTFHFIKSYWASEKDSTFSLRYAMVNTTGKVIKKALWELTRVPVGGLTFWPTGPGGTWGDLAPETEEINGHTWYLRESEDGTNLKFYADGQDGWLAHVDDQNRLFIKTFEDVDIEDFAEREGEIELWVANEYIELENQGICAPIANGATLEYEVTWYLRQLPGHIQVYSGNKDLVDFVKWVISEKETPPSAINPSVIELDMQLYANPAGNILHVIQGKTYTGKISYTIHKLMGQVVLQGELNKETINISSLSEGVYLIRLKSNKASLNRLIYL